MTDSTLFRSFDVADKANDGRCAPCIESTRSVEEPIVHLKASGRHFDELTFERMVRREIVGEEWDDHGPLHFRLKYKGGAQPSPPVTPEGNDVCSALELLVIDANRPKTHRRMP